MSTPLRYTINVARLLAVVTYEAQPTFEQWSETMRSLFSDPAFQPGFGILLDRSKILRPADTDYIKRMVQFIDGARAAGHSGSWAILTADLASFGVGRMAEQLSDSENAIRTFQVRADAETWLADATEGVSRESGRISAGVLTGPDGRVNP